MSDEKKQRNASYLMMPAAEREKRIAALYELMESCAFCPHRCGVNRLRDEKGRCAVDSGLYISSYGPHFGEERQLVGSGGSGTIFFAHCNLNCVFCQNWTISRGLEGDPPTTVDELAGIMLALQKRGCSNINLVTPTPYLYQVTAAIDVAAGKGLYLPIVYNCGGYESVAALRFLEGFVDIYMPDAKYGSNDNGKTYSGAGDYYSRLREALIEMQRQVGDLVTDERGLARRGLMVRHLVLPAGLSGSKTVARMLAEEISPGCAVNVMAQYYPSYRADKFPPLDRKPGPVELNEARTAFSRQKLRLL